MYISLFVLVLFLFVHPLHPQVLGGGEVIGSTQSFPEIFSKERKSQAPLPGAGQSSVSSPSSTQSFPSTMKLEKGVYNHRTGEVYQGTFGGAINPQTGEILPKVGNGYANPKTGEVLPAQ